MSKHSQFVFLSGVLLFVLLASLAGPTAVYADDGAPPPPATEEPVQPPVEESEPEAPPAAMTEAPVMDDAAATEEPTVTEEPEAAATDVSVEEVVDVTPVADSQIEENGAEVTLGEVLEAAPEDTEVVVLDENGETLPLVSEEAAEVVDMVDPMWCPTGETPLNDAADGSVECRSFGTPQLLIDDMDATPALYSQNGTIYFTANPGGAFLLNEDATGLSLASWNTLKGFDLTLQGGWNGATDASFAVDPAVGTIFNGGDRIEVGLGNPWVGNLTINDITINGASQTGLWVFTQGDINLESVTSGNNTGAALPYGAYLYTSGGDIRVANSFFNSNDGDGLRTAAVNGSVTLTNVTANGNGVRGVQGLGGTGVRVTGGSFSNNGRFDGLWLWTNSGDIVLSGVTANDNAANGAFLDTCMSVAGVCTGSGSIVVTSSTFGDGPDADTIGNQRSGLRIVSGGSVEVTGSDFFQNLDNGLSATSFGGSITLEGVTANGNIAWGANLDSGGNIDIRSSTFGRGAASGNFFGLDTAAVGSTTLVDVTASGNGVIGATLTSGGPITVSESYFDGNGAVGLLSSSGSSVTLSNVTASDNGGVALGLPGTLVGGSGPITVTDSHFDRNQFGGLLVQSGSEVSLSGVTANDNGSFGSIVDAAGRVWVSHSYFDGNIDPGGEALGLGIDSDQSISLDYVSASNNEGNGAILSSFENATVVCSQFQDNTNVGADGWDVDGTFMLNDVTFGGNGMDYDGTPVFMSGGCKLVSGKNHKSSALPLHIVPVGGGEQVELDCGSYSGTKLILPNGDQVTLPCPIKDQGVLTGKTQQQLPAPLNAEFGFASAMEVRVIREGEPVSTTNAGMTIDFVIPDGMQAASLVILWWDEQGAQWVEVSGAQTGDGRFVATSKETGVYVLVTK